MFLYNIPLKWSLHQAQWLSDQFLKSWEWPFNDIQVRQFVSEAFQVYLSILNKTVKQSILPILWSNFFYFPRILRTIHSYWHHLESWVVRSLPMNLVSSPTLGFGWHIIKEFRPFFLAVFWPKWGFWKKIEALEWRFPDIDLFLFHFISV